jgi:hypothetical protein
MNTESKRKEIVTLINNIKEHSDRLEDSDSIPLLELSAILSKINRLHETTVVLKYLVAQENHHEDSAFSPSGMAFSPRRSQDEEEEMRKITPEVIELPTASFEVNEEEIETESDLEEGEEIYVEMEVDIDEENIEEETMEGLVSESQLQISDNSELEEGEEIYVEMEVDLDEDIEEKPDPEELLENNDSSDLEEGEEVIVEMEVEFEEEIEELDKVGVLENIEKEELDSLPDLNEQYAENEDNSLGDQLNKLAISDLLPAIGLNERYLYANELFDGELEEFKSQLTILNEFNSIEEAKTYFNNDLSKKLNWNSENEFVKALEQLIERRFL